MEEHLNEIHKELKKANKLKELELKISLFEIKISKKMQRDIYGNCYEFDEFLKLCNQLQQIKDKQKEE